MAQVVSRSKCTFQQTHQYQLVCPESTGTESVNEITPESILVNALQIPGVDEIYVNAEA